MAHNPYSTIPGGSSAAGYKNPYSTNPYGVPGAGPSTGYQAAVVPANAHEYDVGMLEQASAYVPGGAVDKKGGSGGRVEKGGTRKTVIRKGGGKTWEDQTLLDWDTSAYHYRPLNAC